MRCTHCKEDIKPGEIYVSGGLLGILKFHLICKAVWDLNKLQIKRGYPPLKFNDKREEQ